MDNTRRSVLVRAFINTALLLLLQLVAVFTFTTGVALAAEPCQPGSGGLPLPTWYQYLPGEKVNGECDITTKDLGGKVVILILMGVFDILLYLAGLIAVVMVIWGGFKLLTSNGEPQKLAAARTTIFNALVGLVIAAVASQIVGLIAGGLA